MNQELNWINYCVRYNHFPIYLNVYRFIWQNFSILYLHAESDNLQSKYEKLYTAYHYIECHWVEFQEYVFKRSEHSAQKAGKFSILWHNHLAGGCIKNRVQQAGGMKWLEEPANHCSPCNAHIARLPKGLNWHARLNIRTYYCPNASIFHYFWYDWYFMFSLFHLSRNLNKL